MENPNNIHMDHEMMGHEHHEHIEQSQARNYFLFALVIISIAIASIITQYLAKDLTWASLMRTFMGMFFLVFSIFKLLDLKGFVQAYIGYDVVAKRSTAYAYAYPFLELALAIGYFVKFGPTDYATLVLMAIGSIGVIKELLRGSKIKCACLGSFIQLPLTTISLVEDLAMGVMALIGILVLH